MLRKRHNKTNISKSYINFNPAHLKGQVISLRGKQPSDELAVQAWFLYVYSNFKYCMLYVRRMELRTDGSMEKRSDY